jgi:hypothetical protein
MHIALSRCAITASSLARCDAMPPLRNRAAGPIDFASAGGDVRVEKKRDAADLETVSLQSPIGHEHAHASSGRIATAVIYVYARAQVGVDRRPKREQTVSLDHVDR